jgi:hypothetical protein
MTERAIPWDPIPHEYNRLSDVDVSTLSTLPPPTGDGIAVTVWSSPIGEWETEYEWRLSFPHCYAYRVRGVGEWPGALPLTRLKAYWVVNEGHVAFWQVVWSQFIRETVQPGLRWGVHRYVLMSHAVAYEFIADSLRVEDLGNTV